MNHATRRSLRYVLLVLVAASFGACHFHGHHGGGWGWGHGHGHYRHCR
jgi:hypothetical protein